MRKSIHIDFFIMEFVGKQQEIVCEKYYSECKS